MLLGIALLLLVALYLISYLGYYSNFILIFLGVIIWTLFLKSGIHPTLAGILLAFSVPIRQKITTPEFVDNLVEITNNIKKASVSKKPILLKGQISEIDDLGEWTDKYQSPLQNLEHKLHNWVAYLIIPLFAFANSGGVVLSSGLDLETALIVNIGICLVLGKSIGISLIIFIAKKIKLIEVPSDISNQQIIGVSFLAGIGFTMAIFIAV